MKWLFAVLVALNIIVFGGMVASRVAEKQKNTVAPTVPIVDGSQQELSPPLTPSAPAANPPEPLRPDWIGSQEPQTAAVSEPLDDEVALAALAQKAKEAEAAKEKEKKEREEKAKREQLERERAAREKSTRPAEEQGERGSGIQCVSTASISLDEDTYHRIKGLLRQWPHAASRTVERRAAGKSAQSEKSYRVLVAAGGDAIEQLDRLAAKGFSGSIYEGDISVGVVSSRSAAQVLISRLSTAGFGGTRILEQGGESSESGDKSLSVAKMNVTFFGVDDKTAQAIQNVVNRYGRLNRRPCR